MELNKKSVDILLMRNWFVNDDDIPDLLDWLDQDVYDYVYTNRLKYPLRVRYYIEPQDISIPTRYKAKDLTDFDMFKEEKMRFEKKEKEWQKYVNEHKLKRPLSKQDKEKKGKENEITIKEKELEKLKNEYCIPRLQEKQNLQIEKIEDSIIDLKNELRNLLFQIKIEDDKFVQEYKNKWLCGEM